MKTVSNYRNQVLNVNAELKAETKKLNGAIRILKAVLSESKNEDTKAVLSALEAADYNKLKKTVRKSKSGNYSPFFVLQAIYKLSKVAQPAAKLKSATKALKPAKKVTAKAA